MLRKTINGCQASPYHLGSKAILISQASFRPDSYRDHPDHPSGFVLPSLTHKLKKQAKNCGHKKSVCTTVLLFGTKVPWGTESIATGLSPWQLSRERDWALAQ
jgi:hypothetical protein